MEEWYRALVCWQPIAIFTANHMQHDTNIRRSQQQIQETCCQQIEQHNTLLSMVPLLRKDCSADGWKICEKKKISIFGKLHSQVIINKDISNRCCLASANFVLMASVGCPQFAQKVRWFLFWGSLCFFEGFGIPSISGHVPRLGIVEPISVFITY